MAFHNWHLNTIALLAQLFKVADPSRVGGRKNEYASKSGVPLLMKGT